MRPGPGHPRATAHLRQTSRDLPSMLPSLPSNVVACFETYHFVTPPSGRHPNHFIRLRGALHDPTLITVVNNAG